MGLKFSGSPQNGKPKDMDSLFETAARNLPSTPQRDEALLNSPVAKKLNKLVPDEIAVVLSPLMKEFNKKIEEALARIESKTQVSTKPGG